MTEEFVAVCFAGMVFSFSVKFCPVESRRSFIPRVLLPSKGLSITTASASLGF